MRNPETIAAGECQAPGSALMPRASIHQLVAAKDATVAALLTAWDQLQAANALARTAAPSGLSDFPWIAIGSPYGRDCKTFDNREDFAARIARTMDQSVWRHVIRATNLDSLMDKQERETFRAALETAPPPATVDNIAATVDRLLGDADLIFKRGIANAFAKLDRRFRSHDGFKIGARIVLSNALSDFGTWNHYRNHDETLVDVERTFCRLDGKPQPETRDAGVVGLINGQRGGFGKRSTFEVESPYFRVRVFGNGNAHVWFTRKDLVAKVNALLADYYGAALGAGADAADVRHGPSGAVAKNMGWFASPEPVARRVLDEASVYSPKTHSGQYPRLRVLEPNAGEGALADMARSYGHDVTCVELHPGRVTTLAANRHKVINADFLALQPHELGTFDRIVMNPPFDRGLDVEHVTHALQFLAEGGRLCAVMSAGVEFREDARAVAFRAEVERRGGCFLDLPPASFAPATNVNTLLCVIGRRR